MVYKCLLALPYFYFCLMPFKNIFHVGDLLINEGFLKYLIIIILGQISPFRHNVNCFVKFEAVLLDASYMFTMILSSC